MLPSSRYGADDRNGKKHLNDETKEEMKMKTSKIMAVMLAGALALTCAAMPALAEGQTASVTAEAISAKGGQRNGQGGMPGRMPGNNGQNGQPGQMPGNNGQNGQPGQMPGNNGQNGQPGQMPGNNGQNGQPGQMPGNNGQQAPDQNTQTALDGQQAPDQNTQRKNGRMPGQNRNGKVPEKMLDLKLLVENNIIDQETADRIEAFIKNNLPAKPAEGQTADAASGTDSAQAPADGTNPPEQPDGTQTPVDKT